ncbi:MAG: HIT domain-containing protein [Phycisphaerales bacterium]|jgi:ATP adenylyltransferase
MPNTNAGQQGSGPDNRPAGPDSIHAPWRFQYLESLSEDKPAPTNNTGQPTTFLADYWANPQNDHHNHVIARTARGMVLLNAFPYANGHLLVALGEGQPRLLDYSPEDRAHFWMLLELACDLAERTLECQGLNVGINQGRAAGAGVPSHLHAHVVPRWAGDTNFITTVGQIRVVPQALDDMARRYRAAWAQIDRKQVT